MWKRAVVRLEAGTTTAPQPGEDCMTGFVAAVERVKHVHACKKSPLRALLPLANKH